MMQKLNKLVFLVLVVIAPSVNGEHLGYLCQDGVGNNVQCVIHAGENLEIDFQTLSVFINQISLPNVPPGVLVVGVDASSAQGGSVSVSNNVVTYTPPLNVVNPDSFAFTITDNAGQNINVSGTVNVTVYSGPIAPIVPATTEQGVAVEVELENRISHTGGDTNLTVSFPSQAATPFLNQVTPTRVLITPPPDFTGVQSIDYVVTDSNGVSDSGQIILTVGQSTSTTINKTVGSDVQFIKLNTTRTFEISAETNGSPVVGAPVTWELWEMIDGVAQAPTDPNVSLTAGNTVTNALGISQATFFSSDQIARYRIRATVQINNTPAVTDFFVQVGFSGIAVPDTYSQALGQNLETVCRQLQGQQLNGDKLKLQAFCEVLKQAASLGNNADVLRALDALSPEEVVTQSRTNRQIGVLQLKNIISRLEAVRRGVRGFSAKDLGFNVQGENLPRGLAHYALPEDMRGGGASADQVASDWSFFTSGLMGLGDRQATGREDGFEFNTMGLTGGMDYRINRHMVAGVAFGMATSDLELGAQAGQLEVQGYSMTAYGTFYSSRKMYLDAVLTLSNNTFDSVRIIDTGLGNPIETALGSTDSSLLAFSAGGGYELYSRRGLNIIAKSRLDYMKSTIKGYDEVGAGAFNLSLDDQELTSVILSAGIKINWAKSFRWGIFNPQFDLSAEHEFEGNSVSIKGNFVNDSFGNSFAFKTDELDQDYFDMGLGFTMVFPGGVSGFFQYQAFLSQSYTSTQNLALGLRFEF